MNSPSVWAPVAGSPILVASGDFIWVTDGANFYTYNTQSLEFNTYSLLKLYRYNNSSDITINDAEWVLSKMGSGNKFWYLPIKKIKNLPCSCFR